MTEVELYQPPAALAVPVIADMDSWISVCSDVIKVANVICDTPFVPDGLRGSGPAVAAAILAGRELALGPMTSLANIHVIKGKPALSAVLMRALIQGAGHQWEDVDVTDSRAVIRARRRGESEWTTVSFTADQARQAKIDLGGYPQDKLYARATSRLARRKFADVIAGMPYSAEELEDGEAAEGTVAETAAGNGQAAADVKPRTARRRQAPAADRPTGAVSATASAPTTGPAPTQTAPPGPGLPPLPGEEDPGPTPPASAAESPPNTGSSTAPPAESRSKPSRLLTGVIQQHFKRLGFGEDEREQRLVATAVLAGAGEITSTNDLSEEQKSTVADTLSRCRDRGRLIELLTAAENAAAGGE